ncbi:DNA-binding protein [Virgibacillus profundi]|uniref:DNA-binding protein n=1 Tax=Virgibacillus profundi TaxID=2024555 RepID=A0A2A2I9F5_9BACI|nr:DNA-binding protein [Virgibacillus profundi]PXY51930.1 DNA-binding protein [Virgibacillus profundi]
MGYIAIAFGIAAAGYFIGEGLKNFKNADGKDLINNLFNEDDEHELIKEKDVHHFLGTSKEDASLLISEHPDVPHVKLNGKVYFPKAKLREWLLKMGD